MKSDWVISAALLLAILVSCVSAADRPSRFEKPEEVVTWLYRDFGREILPDHDSENDLLIDQPARVLSRYFTSKLAALIAKDRQFEIKTKELGHLDFVLLVGSQDPDGIKNLRIE